MTGSDLKHRLAAILAADAAGYSRLMAADERGTVAVLDAARAIFRKHIDLNQGRVVDMAGDSVLAVFDTATGAASAALAIQADLVSSAQDIPLDRQLPFRIGLHLGDVIEKTDGTIYGDGVNIAARLQALAEAGGTVLSDSVRNAVRGKVGASFDDLGEQAVKNIAEPVRAYRVHVAGGSESTPATVSKSVTSSMEIDLSLPDKPSIAVLPFTNMSGDPEQEYFTDGVSEDIITELSRFHSLFVIARNSSFAYKGKSPDIRQVGRELGVRYVLEGSIRKSSNRIRVTAQLIDALTGSHIWAEKYDRVLEDIFAVQEEVTAAIVQAIAPRIGEAELGKITRKRHENLSAYEIAIRSRNDLDLAYARQDRALCQRGIDGARAALAIDPNSVLALYQLGLGLWLTIITATARDRRAAWMEAFSAATRMIELDRTGHEGYAARGVLMAVSSSEGSAEQALDDCSHAHDLNPNDFRTLQGLGWVEMLQGRHADATKHLLQALRANPRDPWAFFCPMTLADVCFFAGSYDDGLAWALRAIRQAPVPGNEHHTAALCYVGLGQLDKARLALEVARRNIPEFIDSALNGRSVLRRPEDRRKYTVFLRIAAGLEDLSAADALR